MKVVYHDAQKKHNPRHFLASGAQHPNPEQPGRIDALVRGAEKAGLSVHKPRDSGLGPIARVHGPDYLKFLQHIFTRWQRIDGASDEVIPNIHPDRRSVGYPKSAVGQAGYHQMDTACPIAKDTWNSAYWSAQSAIAAADLVVGGEPSSYALCRPPGHHAFGDLAGGFCFLNNSAIAADYFTALGKRVAIVDVDLHHGNGTQSIFYQRRDVFTVSVHADPIRYYPFFWGYAEERGEGTGRGYNLNLPLARGTGDDGFLEALKSGVASVETFDPDVVIVALGLDAFEGDPFGGLSVSTQGFQKIGEMLAGLARPSVIVQEGGYLCPELGQNLTRFLNGFQDAHQARTKDSIYQ